MEEEEKGQRAFVERFELSMNTGSVEAAAGIRRVLIYSAAAAGCNITARMIRNSQSVDASYAKVMSWGLTETDVVYGGLDKCLQSLETELDRKKDAYDLVLIVAGDASSLIGDDIQAAAASLEARYGLPALALDAPGFKGSWVDGADLLYTEVVKKLGRNDVQPQEKMVNLIGTHLSGSKNWKNDLEEIKRLLAELGLTVNCVLTNDTPVKAIENFFQAQASIYMTFEELPLFKRLCQDRGMRIVAQDLVPPYGCGSTENWLYALADEFGLYRKKAEEILRKDYQRVARIFRGNYNSSWVFEGISGRSAAILAPVTFGTALANLLFYDFNIYPRVVALYHTSEEALKIAQSHLSEELSCTVLSNPNRREVAELVTEMDVDFVFGMLSDRQLFESLGRSHCSMAGPYFFNNFIFIPWPYTGIRGMLYVASELAMLFNNHTHARDKWLAFPYFPVADDSSSPGCHGPEGEKKKRKGGIQHGEI